MTDYEQCKIFWSWGNHQLDYYQIYVQLGLITTDQFKEITGEDYVTPKLEKGSVATPLSPAPEDVI